MVARSRFNFEHLIAPKTAAGEDVWALVIVYGVDDFELLNPDTGTPISINDCSPFDQVQIEQEVAERWFELYPADEGRRSEPHPANDAFGPSYVSWVNGGSR
jgi:hypothetical protein